MSFDTLKVKELREIAESFAVDIPQKATKQEIIMVLEEEGVDFNTYAKFSDAEKIEPEKGIQGRPQQVDIRNPDTVVVKMVRNNMSYQIGDYVFSQEHPFVPMSSDHAQRIFDSIEGFVLATPREVQEYYG